MKEEKHLVNHTVLQTMACTLKKYDYRDLRNLYEAYHLHVTPRKEQRLRTSGFCFSAMLPQVVLLRHE